MNIKPMYLRIVNTHGGQKLWFYSSKDWTEAKFIGEFNSIEEAVNKSGRAYAGNTN